MQRGIRMEDHKCFPQFEIGTGKILCRDCDRQIDMTQQEWADYVQWVIANATEFVLQHCKDLV